MKLCSVPGCSRPLHGKGLCNMHRKRLASTGETGGAKPMRTTEKVKCSVHGCDRIMRRNGMCEGHNARRAKGLDISGPLASRSKHTADHCTVPGCTRPVNARNKCKVHSEAKRKRDAEPGTIRVAKALTESWRDDAACRPYPTDPWFADPKSKAGKWAIEVCNSCPVKSECKAEVDAMRDVVGIWAGRWITKTTRRLDAAS